MRAPTMQPAVNFRQHLTRTIKRADASQSDGKLKILYGLGADDSDGAISEFRSEIGSVALCKRLSQEDMIASVCAGPTDKGRKKGAFEPSRLEFRKCPVGH